jgi:hypothetical protein
MANLTIGKIVTALKLPLKELGFTHRKGNHFTKALDSNVVAHIYLRPLRRCPDGLPVSPHIGVRHEGLMKLVCGLVGAKLGDYLPVTLDARLGNLITDGKRYGDGAPNGEWRIADADGLQAQIPQMIEAIEKFGIPFLNANDSLSGIVETLIEHFHFEGDLYEEGTFDTIHPYGYVAPAALFLLGRKDELGAFLEKQMQQHHKNGKGGWAEPYRIYTRKLLDLVDERDGKKRAEDEKPDPIEKRVHSMVADKFDNLTQRLAGPLADLGFEPFGESRFRRIMNEDTRGTLWLFPKPDLSTKGFTLSPMVGVKHKGIAEALAEIEGNDDNHSEDSPPSLWAPLFAIVPPIPDPGGWLISIAKDTWPIPGGAVHGLDIDDFIADVRDYVIPFMEAHDSLEAITEKLSVGLFDLHYMPGYMPAVALYMAGCYDDVLDALQTTLFRRISPDEDKNKAFRKFCRQMILRMEADGWAPLSKKRMKVIDAYIEESAPKSAQSVRHQPLVKALDDILIERGFEKNNRSWRRETSQAVFGVYFSHETDFINHDLEYGVWFRDHGGEPPAHDKDGLYGYHVKIELPQDLDGRLKHRLNRATQFGAGWDYAGKTDVQWDCIRTIPERFQVLRDMEGMKPLTMEWRIFVLCEVMEQVVLTVFDKVEHGEITSPDQVDRKGEYPTLAVELLRRRAAGNNDEALIDFLFDMGHPPMEAIEIWGKAFDPGAEERLDAEMDAMLESGKSLEDIMDEVLDDARKADDEDAVGAMMNERWRARRLDIWKRGL